ncbi:unnamed protein product, partial [Closterium sp. Naga37s-1]
MEPREEENQPLIAPGFIRGTASASSNRSGGSSWAVGSPSPSAFEASGTVGLAPVTGSGATVSLVHTARSADSTSASNWAFHAEATDRDYRSPSVSPFASPIAASAVPPPAAPVAAYSKHEAFAFTVDMRGEGAAGVGPAGVGPATGGGAAGRGGEVEDRGSAPWAMARAVERGMSGDPADGLEQPLQPARLAPLESPELRAILHKSASMLRFESIRRRKGSGSDDSLASQQHLLPPGAAGSVGSGRHSLSRADSGGSAGSFGSAGGGGGSGSNSLNVTPESSFHRGDMYSGSMFE